MPIHRRVYGSSTHRMGPLQKPVYKSSIHRRTSMDILAIKDSVYYPWKTFYCSSRKKRLPMIPPAIDIEFLLAIEDSVHYPWKTFFCSSRQRRLPMIPPAIEDLPWTFSSRKSSMDLFFTKISYGPSLHDYLL